MQRTASLGLRLMSALLCIIFIATLLSAPPRVMAKDDRKEEISSTTFDDLGLPQSAEQAAENREQIAPFGSGITSLNTINELYVDYATSMSSGYLSVNQDAGQKALTLNYESNAGSSGFLKRYGLSNAIDSYSTRFFLNAPGAITGGDGGSEFFQEKQNSYTTQVYSQVEAFNSGSGRDDMIAKLSIDYQYNLTLCVSHLQEKGNAVKASEISLGKLPMSQPTITLYRWEYGAFVELTAGDFNGDGKDEIAVYVPDATYATNDNEYGSSVNIYSFDSDSSTLALVAKVTLPMHGDFIFVGESGAEYNDDLKCPGVSLTASDLRGDYSEELVIAINPSYGHVLLDNIDERGSKIRIYDFAAGFDKTPNLLYDKNMLWRAEDGYELSNGYLRMYGANVDAGDINGDGAQELMIAGYSSVYFDWRNKSDCYLYTWLYMDDSGAIVSGTHDMAYAVTIPYEDFTTKLLPAQNVYIPPIALEIAATQGIGYPEQVLLGTLLYGWNAQESVFAQSARGTYNLNAAARAYTGRLMPYMKINEWQDEHTDGTGQAWNQLHMMMAEMWIDNTISGNFNGNPYGQEQIIFTTCLRKNTSDERYWMDMGAISKKQPGGANAAGDGNYYRVTERVSNHDVTSAQHEGVGIAVGNYVALAAVDYDRDSTLVRTLGSEVTYTNPEVLAVLQSAPYFADLESLDEDYPSNGSTAFGDSASTTHGCTFGSSLSASLSVEFEQEAGIFGIKLAQVQAEQSLTTALSSETTNACTWEKGVEYSNNSDEDSVVVATIPRVIYHCEAFIPSYTIPSEGAYDAWATERLQGTYRTEGARWADFDEQTRAELLAQYKRVLPPGGCIEEHWEAMNVNVDLPMITSIVPVETYDATAAETVGLEPIRGNILKNVNGDPLTYTVKPDKMISEGYIGTSASSSSSSLSGSESEEFSRDSALEMSVESKAGVGAGGVTVLAGTGFTSNSSTFTGTCHSSNFCGTVANMPRGADEYGYTFAWNFGYSMKEINGNRVPVLMYHTRSVAQPPSLPSDMEIDATTQDTVTLHWKRGNRPAESYTIYNYDAITGFAYRLAGVPGTQNTFTDTNLAPNTAYFYKIQANSSGNRSVLSLPLTARTQPSGENIPMITEQPQDVLMYPGGSATFSVGASGVAALGTLYYQWDCNDGSGWEEIPSANTRSYCVDNVVPRQDGYRYRCRVYQRLFGTPVVVVSQTAILSVSKSDAVVECALTRNEERLNDKDYITPNHIITKTENDVTTEETVAGDVLTLTAIVGGESAATPSGMVNFLINCVTNSSYSVSLSVPLGAEGKAVTKWSAPSEGVFSVSAEYLGDERFRSSDSEQISLNAFAPISDTVLLTIDAKEMTYGDTQIFRAYLVDATGINDALENIEYRVSDKDGNAVDSEWMSKSEPSFATADTFTPHCMGTYTVTATCVLGENTVTVSDTFSVERAVLTVQAPEITRNLSASRPITSSDLTLIGLRNADDVDENTFRLVSIYGYDENGEIISVPTEANTGQCGSYPIFAEPTVDLSDRYSVVTQNGFYTILRSRSDNAVPTAQFAGVFEVTIETSSNATVTVKRREGQTADMAGLKLYKAQYGADGALESIGSIEGAFDDDEVIFTVQFPSEGDFKLLLWHDMLPITKSMRAIWVGTEDTIYSWEL